MGLFDDFSQFLEMRLEEFLRNNPHLEIQALEEQIREQEEDTQRLIADLQLKEKQLQDQILSIGQDIKLWHERIDKARLANRMDLAQAAQEREASLLRLGNQRWGQMEGVKKRLVQSKELLRQIQQRRREIKAQAAAQASYTSAQSSSSRETVGWNQASNYNTRSSQSADPLENQFQRWETEEELERMKRNLGR